MEIIFLGTGTSTGVPQIGCSCEVCKSDNPKDRRLRSSILIKHKGVDILIDCGPDFREQMLRSNTDNLDVVMLTHKHYDHIAALDELRSFSYKKEIPIYADKDVEMAVKAHIPYCFAPNPYPGIARISFNRINNTPFTIQNNITVTPIEVMHYNLPLFGFRLDNFAYITDMLTISDIELEKLKGLDTLVINALRHTEHISHQTLQDALQVIAKVKPKAAYLTHISHQMGLQATEEPKLPNGVHFAYDGLRVCI